MLPLFDELTGERVEAEMIRSQEFVTGRSAFHVSQGVVELSDHTIRYVRVLRRNDLHGNCRVVQTRHGVDFDTAVGSLRTELQGHGLITQVMPRYDREGS